MDKLEASIAFRMLFMEQMFVNWFLILLFFGVLRKTVKRDVMEVVFL